MVTWKDVMSYKRDDTSRVPHAVEWRPKLAAEIRLVVTRHIQYKNTWLMLCPAIGVTSHYDLKTDDLEEAKAKALHLFRGEAEILINSLTDAREEARAGRSGG